MQEKTVLLAKFDGIRNDVDSERLSVRDLASGTNVDLDLSGKPSTRLGFTQRVACAPSSFEGFGSYGYFLDGTDLKRFAPPSTILTLRSGLSPTKRIAFEEMNGDVFYSNTEVTGKITQGMDRPWGIAVPDLPTASTTAGDLRSGWYGYTMTFVRRNGQESGAKRMNIVQVTDNSGLLLQNIPISTDPDVTTKNIYFTGRNGETPMLVGSIPNATTSFSYLHNVAGARPVATMFRGPPPSGHLLSYFNGRIFIAQGSYLWHTDAFAPEQVDFRQGFTPIGDEITVVAPVETGIFVATQNRTLFLAGDSPEKFMFTEVAPYGAPLGNHVYVDGSKVTKDGIPKTVVGWLSKKGFCVGSSDGTLTNMTQSRYILPSVNRAATVFKQRGGLTQFISVLYT